MDIVLGLKYEDAETGFIGIATSRTTFHHAEPLVFLENENGSRYFEEIRLRQVAGQEGLNAQVQAESTIELSK